MPYVLSVMALLPITGFCAALSKTQRMRVRVALVALWTSVTAIVLLVFYGDPWEGADGVIAFALWSIAILFAIAWAVAMLRSPSSPPTPHPTPQPTPQPFQPRFVTPEPPPQAGARGRHWTFPPLRQAKRPARRVRYKVVTARRRR